MLKHNNINLTDFLTSSLCPTLWYKKTSPSLAHCSAVTTTAQTTNCLFAICSLGIHTTRKAAKNLVVSSTPFRVRAGVSTHRKHPAGALKDWHIMKRNSNEIDIFSVAPELMYCHLKAACELSCDFD